MANKYDPYSAINSIYKLKGEWDSANNAGDTATRDSVAAQAQSYYNQLRSNGYKDVADELSKSNYTQAKAINDKWAKTGKTSTRDYLYSLGKSKGMSQSDVDSLIGWDGQTGEVSFGGKKIGTPDTIVDGVSYWSDTSVLDNAFNDYISRSGTTASNETLASQNSAEVQNKVNQLWGTQTSDRETMAGKYNKLEDTAYSNPFTTDEAKAILSKYDLAGLQGRSNAVASGGASNGGNIDSYAAANAMRQQAALVNQGQMAVLEAHNNKINNVKGILESLGVYQQNQDTGMQNTIGLQQYEAQRLFENSETAKNNEVARLSEQASVSGYVPNEWVIKNDDVYNTYLNADGTFKKEMENVDIQALINSAKASGDTETANKLAVVRARKILGNYGEYGQYANEGDISYMKPQRTADFDLSKLGIESAERISQNEINAQKEMQKNQIAGEQALAHINGQYGLDLAGLEGEYGLKAIGLEGEYGLDLAGLEGEYGLKAIGLEASSSGSKPTLTAAQARDAIKAGETSQAVIDAYNYYYGTSYTVDNPPTLKDTSDYKIEGYDETNKFIKISGLAGRYTVQEAAVMLENGEIKEVYDHENKTVRYVKR